MKKIPLTIFIICNLFILPEILFAQFMQQGPKLVGTGANGLPRFGNAVAISADGNTAIIGGVNDYNNNYAGGVWIFIRNGNTWMQQGPKLVGTGSTGTDWQGRSVDISSDGNTVVFGGRGNNSNAGAVWVFTRSGGVWTQQGPKLVGAGAIGNASQGFSVSISSDGNTIVDGGKNDNTNIGAVWIFTRNQGIWSQLDNKLIGSGYVNHPGQGTSVDISADGNTLVEGGMFDNGIQGAVWIFTRNGNTWQQQGTKLVGTGGSGNISGQGSSVSISSDGNTVIEGGYYDDSSKGAVWVFSRSGNNWTQQGQKLIGSGATSGIVGSSQGCSLSISPNGSVFVEGGWNDGNGLGAFWVFTRTGSVWSQLGTKIIGTGAIGDAGQGYSVAISSEGTIIEGGLWDNNQFGAFWVFKNPTIGITPISNEIPVKFSLSQNYPNPFNPSTKIKFDIPANTNNENAQLIIYDVSGRLITTLINKQMKPGSYEVEFDGSKYASGIYFYKLSEGDYSEVKKMSLIK